MTGKAWIVYHYSFNLFGDPIIVCYHKVYIMRIPKKPKMM